jgi:hypothetical protein
MSNEKNIFEVASRNKTRFVFKGSLSVEDLWDLNLTDLDSIFKSLNKQLKLEKEESLLDTKTAANEEITAKVEIIKYIVDTRVAENKVKANAKKKNEERQKILALMALKKDEANAGKTYEELEAMLSQIDNE